MKITIELTQEQVKQLKNQLATQNTLTFEEPQKKIGLHKKTIEFINDLQSHYGKGWIYRADKRVNDIWHKHKIHDIGNILVRLQKFNMCEIVYHESKTRKRINKFRFI